MVKPTTDWLNHVADTKRVGYGEKAAFKESMLYNATNNRLQRRDKLIAQRLKELLLWKEHVCDLRFQYEDEYHLGARTIGYRRYHLVLSYKTTW